MRSPRARFNIQRAGGWQSDLFTGREAGEYLASSQSIRGSGTMEHGMLLINLLRWARLVLAITILLAWGWPLENAHAQDLEPRRWTHLPVGLNVLGVGSGWTDGDILFDPVLRIEDATFDLQLAALGYSRAFDVFGKTARLDVKLPYATGRWEGLLDGEPASVRRHGFMDPSLRFSVNLIGAPALKGTEFVDYRRSNPVNTTVGAAVSVIMPFGEYYRERLINLGSNRWIVRPQIGALHQRGPWQFELTGSVFLYQTNHEFWPGQSVWEQDPLWFAQAHVIRSFEPGWWASLSGGFAYGGQSTVNEDVKQDDNRSRYMALSLGMPISKTQAIKITYLTSDTHISVGKNTAALIVGWSVNWGR